MHDLDRTQLEYGLDALESDEFEYNFEEEWELSPDVELASPFTEAEEMELAAELMTISSEEELDQFLGKLFKGVWRGIKKVGSFVGRVAKPLGGILKGIAKKALPFVGGALGSLIPIPGVGTAVGSALGGALSKALEAELEGLSGEDQEFEMARRFVRIAGAAAQEVANAAPTADPVSVAKNAVTAAAKQQVPGLAAMSAAPAMSRPAPSVGGGMARSGRWVRRGRKIILLGV
jgi:hypothetical protein